MKRFVSLFALCLCCLSAHADTVLIPTLTYTGSTNYRAFSIASATSAVSRYGSNVVYDYAVRVVPTNTAPTAVFLLPAVYKCTFDGVTTPVTFRVDGLSNTVYLVDIATNGFASTTATVGSATLTDVRNATNLAALRVASSNIIGLVTGSASIAAGSNATVAVVNDTNVISAEVGAAAVAAKLDKVGGSASNLTVTGESFWNGTNFIGDHRLFADPDSGDFNILDSRGDTPVRIREGYLYGMGFISDNPEVYNLWQIQQPDTFSVVVGVDTNGVLHVNAAGVTNIPQAAVNGLLTLSNRVTVAEGEIDALQAGGGGGGGTATNGIAVTGHTTNGAYVTVWTNAVTGSNWVATIGVTVVGSGPVNRYVEEITWSVVCSNGVTWVVSTNGTRTVSRLAGAPAFGRPFYFLGVLEWAADWEDSWSENFSDKWAITGQTAGGSVAVGMYGGAVSTMNTAPSGFDDVGWAPIVSYPTNTGSFGILYRNNSVGPWLSNFLFAASVVIEGGDVTNSLYVAGLSTSTTPTPTDAARWFARRDWATNWIAMVMNNSSATYWTSALPVLASTRYDLAIRAARTNSVEFFTNGVLATTLTNNLPVSRAIYATLASSSLSSSGSANKNTLWVDWWAGKFY